MENEIKLAKDDILRLRIKTADGKDTGESLEFDLEDLELPLRYQEMMEKDKKNVEWLEKELTAIKKRQDIKGKKLLSKNEEDALKAINKYFQQEAEIYNMFLGENGVEKLLNGRKLGWTSLEEIGNIIKNQIVPYFEKIGKEAEDKINMIKEKYKKAE